MYLRQCSVGIGGASRLFVLQCDLESKMKEIIFKIAEIFASAVVEIMFKLTSRLFTLCRKLFGALNLKITAEGEIKNKKKFHKILKKLTKNSNKISVLNIEIWKNKKFINDLSFLDKKAVIDSYEIKEKRIKNAFYLLLADKAKEALFATGLTENDVEDILQIVVKFCVKNENERKDVMIDCANSKIIGRRAGKLFFTVPIKKDLLLDAMEKSNGIFEPRIDASLKRLGLDLGDIKDIEWRKHEFIPHLLYDTVQKICANPRNLREIFPQET